MRNDELICNRIPKMKMNDLLKTIMSILIYYVNANGKMPKKILLHKNDYMRIKKERADVLISRDNKDYILGMEINY